MAILVTGATGFIGRHLTKRLLAEGDLIRVVTRDPGRLPPEWSSRVEVVTGNLRDRSIQEVATKGAKVLFNLAGETQNVALMRAVNVEAVKGLLEAAVAAGVKRVVHLSSVGVIGADRPGVINEETPCQPKNGYEQTKFEGEQAVIEFAQSGRIEAVIIRPTIVFGEGQERYRDSLLEWLKTVQRGRFYFIGRKAIANFVYVGDVVEVVVRLAECPANRSAVYIIADPAPMCDFVQAMAQALGVAVPTSSVPVWLAYAAGVALDVTNRILGMPAPLTLARVRALSSQCLFSGDRLRKEVGLLLPFGYRAGLLRTVRWYRDVGSL